MSKPLHLNPSNFIFMKGWIITLLLIISMSCNHQPDDMAGKWKTHSKHYTATFQIFEEGKKLNGLVLYYNCLLYTSPSPRDRTRSRMPSSA